MTTAYQSLSHPQRIPLAAEIHSRPFLRLEAPEAITHLAVYRDGDGPRSAHASGQHALLAQLCTHFGVAAPHVAANHFYHDFGRFRLKWECHTEFATYTITHKAAPDADAGAAFARMPLAQLPQSWILALHGRLIAASHVLLARGAADPALLQAGFEGGGLVGARVMQGGELWTDFIIHPDGFSRFVLCDVDMRAQQAGRLAQRVLEIETYRMMALLGLPVARTVGAALDDIEAELATLAARMVDGAAADDQTLLGRITALAARLERLSLEHGYRFSASKAYYRLVKARIDELREVRTEGVPTVEEFMDRRLTPAMNTCEAVAARLDALGRRIANVNDLLRTRVSIVQEDQNRRILQSMDRRAAQQLRLQQAVEGLSVAAISYYVVGLLGYAGKAAKALGAHLNPEVATGALVPVVAAVVWLGLRRMHRRMHERTHG
ncbi:DUF3422 domain-containing protein [Massilia forsythiae]|uniref:DUF3422 domain-containing protein n=1 Tax=Massilia forsythiae TaxID=2728020 RepID=A0A7Z2W345_9BURK|nr:DUF3422 domain-containing protein [Massilia forsythiae]QJE03530.1 DUF3422 domain-containing protein [Massilia forsythiae]